ncbi:MAG TPA: TlpA disulfide reductase family protein, partial [Propionibacteriaceae bacterium]|nr:TlpA disulfide reductase family protein [Propionibacteriaceae bacterium]
RSPRIASRGRLLRRHSSPLGLVLASLARFDRRSRTETVSAHFSSTQLAAGAGARSARAIYRARRCAIRVGVGLAAIVLLTACASTGADEQTRSAGQVGYPTVPRNLTQIPPEERKELPAVTGPALGSNKKVSTQDYRGKVVVINVWGSWCPPCRKEAPDLQAASVETKNVAQFIGITSKDYDPAPAEAFVRSFKITYPSIYDPSGKALLAFAGELPPSAIPSTLIIDREGRLAVRVLGEVSKITLVDMINGVADGQ